MNEYLPIFTLFVLAVLFAGLSFVASSLLAKQRPTGAKVAPYECGIVPTREPAERFPVRFYLVAMIFIVFDIEIIFLYPWAVLSGNEAFAKFGLGEMITLAVVVFIAFLYLISNGALDWGPLKRTRPVADATRTSSNTVRRVRSSAEETAEVV